MRRLAALGVLVVCFAGAAGAEERREQVTSPGASATNRVRIVAPEGSSVTVEQHTSVTSGDHVVGSSTVGSTEPEPVPSVAPPEHEPLLDGAPRAEPVAPAAAAGPDPLTWIVVAVLAAGLAYAYRRLPKPV